jgi:hypothetical protein
LNISMILSKTSIMHSMRQDNFTEQATPFAELRSDDNRD